jgi:hypothetical protein
MSRDIFLCVQPVTINFGGSVVSVTVRAMNTTGEVPYTKNQMEL